jgi:hypothetical protein
VERTGPPSRRFVLEVSMNARFLSAGAGCTTSFCAQSTRRSASDRSPPSIGFRGGGSTPCCFARRYSMPLIHAVRWHAGQWDDMLAMSVHGASPALVPRTPDATNSPKLSATTHPKRPKLWSASWTVRNTGDTGTRRAPGGGA